MSLLGVYRVADGWRVGLGVAHVAAPRLWSSGLTQDAEVRYRAHTGLVVEGEYLVTPHVGVKLRYASHRYAPQGGGQSLSGDYGAVMLSHYF